MPSEVYDVAISANWKRLLDYKTKLSLWPFSGYVITTSDVKLNEKNRRCKQTLSTFFLAPAIKALYFSRWINIYISLKNNPSHMEKRSISSDRAGARRTTADDKTTSWILVQDSSGETRLMTQDELERCHNVPSFIGSGLPVNISLPIQEQNNNSDCNIEEPSENAPDINNNHIHQMVSTTYTDDSIETLRSQQHNMSMERPCETGLSYKNPPIELVMDEDLDSSLTHDGSLLEHISRQIAIQQPYLNPDNNGQPLTYHIEEIPMENVEALGDSFTIVPNMMNQHQHTWFQTPHQQVELRGSSQNKIYEQATMYTPTNHHKQAAMYTPTSHHKQVDNTMYTPTSHHKQQLQYIPSGNSSTPIRMHSILQPSGTNDSGRHVYTPHPKTGQVIYVSEPQIQYMSQPLNASTATIKTKTTNTSTPKNKHKTKPEVPNWSKKSESNFALQPIQPEVANWSKKSEPNFTLQKSDASSSQSPKPVTDKTEEKENMSPDSSKSPGELDLDFPPMFINSGNGEESREQHNLKERKRRARIKDACEVMRKLVPGMSDKTDKATVFEFAARYIHFLKGFTGNKHDKDFLLKYSPY
ncbi:Hypothetical predicted protein [Mytilus galloprovincialis]|uniref:BHLH domain-containing protein n=1 Tax=Mytilus galloprovincialis TaxID=29158 RepID=A0A8B6DWY8_MYTGA|nr:Hypothetical predicted protein [Mytilus galloprovincialis]